MPRAAAVEALITDAQACDLLGITRRQMRDLRYRREIAYVKVGREVRYERAELRRYIDRNRVGAA